VIRKIVCHINLVHRIYTFISSIARFSLSFSLISQGWPWLLHMAHKVSVLTFVLAHKACTFALTLSMTSQDYLSPHLFRLGSQGLYVGLDSCHDSQDCLISKSPWLASGWSLKTSRWRMASDAATFNTKCQNVALGEWRLTFKVSFMWKLWIKYYYCAKGEK
jgi:hypothetical protein